jgi:hypothetical protein
MFRMMLLFCSDPLRRGRSGSPGVARTHRGRGVAGACQGGILAVEVRRSGWPLPSTYPGRAIRQKAAHTMAVSHSTDSCWNARL